MADEVIDQEELHLSSRNSSTRAGRNVKHFNANEAFEKIYDKAAATSSKGKTVRRTAALPVLKCALSKQLISHY